MNTNQAQPPGQGQGSTGPQSVPLLFRPEQMRSLPDGFSAEDKQKWENGLIMLYKTMERHPPDSQQHQDARKKVQEFSATLRSKIQLARAREASQAQARAAGGPAAQPASKGASNQAAAQPAKAPQPQKPSEQMLAHINNFPYVLPAQFIPGTPEAAKWLQDAKTRYGKALLAMETSTVQLRTLEHMLKERNEQGKPLTESEQKEFHTKKEQLQKNHADAKRYSENFRKQQESANEQAKAANGQPATERPAGNVSQQTQNTLQQTTETVNAAMQAARNQQIHGGRPSMPIAGQPALHNDHTSQAPLLQSGNAPSNLNDSQGPSNQSATVKIEGSRDQPHINTAIATAPHMQQTNLPRQQNSPHSAVPQSATLTSNPRPLSHPAALQAAARTYSSTQTSGTPNVMGGTSHAHPSVPRETPNINTNKMPIPKQLPPGATAPPQPVSMPPSRPTISGGPSNAGNGVMGQPVLQKTPGFNIAAEGERVLNKRKLDDLVRQVTGGGEGLDGGEGLTPEVEDCILSVADEFVDQVINAACKCAKARGSKCLEIRDIQLILERNYNIRIPGYASDEIRTVRKFQPAQGWIAKMSAIQAAKVTGGKSDL